MTRIGFGLLAVIGAAAFVACSLVNSFDEVQTEPDTSTGGGSNTGTGSNTNTGTGTLTWTGGGGTGGEGYCKIVKDGACGLSNECDGLGECCTKDCSNANCDCTHYCHCLFTCKEPPCKKISCTSALGAETYCEGEAGGDTIECKVNAVCHLTCVDDPCHMECKSNAKCYLNCGSLSGVGGNAPCGITECGSGDLKTCSNGFACGRDCP
jgi:hypothetical protein